MPGAVFPPVPFLGETAQDPLHDARQAFLFVRGYQQMNMIAHKAVVYQLKLKLFMSLLYGIIKQRPRDGAIVEDRLIVGRCHKTIYLPICPSPKAKVDNQSRNNPAHFMGL
jgi:hypothetical protein